MGFACFAPSSDTFATLPRGVTLVNDDATAFPRRPSKRRSQPHPDPRAVSSDALRGYSFDGDEDFQPLDKTRMRRISKAMVGSPTDFVHRGHLGADEIKRAVFDRGSLADLTSALARLAAPLPDPPFPTVSTEQLPLPGTSRTSFDAVAFTPVAPPPRPLSPALSISSRPSLDGLAVEEGTAFGGRSRSPPPEVIHRPLSPLLGSPASASVETIIEQRVKPPVQHKVKRKAAPAFIPSKIISPPAGADATVTQGTSDGATTVLTERDLPIPLDGKGRPMHYVAGNYITDTSKFKWDGAMDAITQALREGADAPQALYR